MLLVFERLTERAWHEADPASGPRDRNALMARSFHRMLRAVIGFLSAITLDLPTYCKTGSGAVTWCTRSVATNRYGLYRAVGSSCTGGVLWADYMVPSGSAPTCGTPTALCVFAYTAGSTTSLALLHVDLPVNLKPSRTVDLYELADDIVLRNSSRS